MVRPVRAPRLLAAGALLVLAACAGGDRDARARAASPVAPADAPGAGRVVSAPEHAAAADGLYALRVTSLEGEPVDLARYRGKVALVVNVASECGFTPQYAGLQQLHDELAGEGLVVLGFPSNDFGGQEPGGPEQIRAFCTSRYGVTFPLFEKVQTRPGAGQSPVYQRLADATGELPNWNFCKYLVGRDGTPLRLFSSRVAPGSDELRAAVRAALDA